MTDACRVFCFITAVESVCRAFCAEEIGLVLKYSDGMCDRVTWKGRLWRSCRYDRRNKKTFTSIQSSLRTESQLQLKTFHSSTVSPHYNHYTLSTRSFLAPLICICKT